MRHQPESLAHELDTALAALTLEERLALVAERFPSIVFTTSLGPEDQAITHAIATNRIRVRIVTLDTGRLFPETVSLLEKTRERYAIDIEEFRPKPQAITTYKDRYGLNGFYESVEARQTCCHVRKIEPLQRALSGTDGWITGLRREQSQNRGNIPFAEWSDEYGLMKFNLLADWTLKELNTVLQQNDVPVNELHARGYPSIGCEPCTRAITAGEPERAGRWWWESEQKRECGLHVVAPHTTPNSTPPTSLQQQASHD